MAVCIVREYTPVHASCQHFTLVQYVPSVLDTRVGSGGVGQGVDARSNVLRRGGGWGGALIVSRQEEMTEHEAH